MEFCFPCTSELCATGFQRCDDPPMSLSSQDCACFGPPDKPCADCFICMSPFAFVCDIFTLCPRVTVYSYMECKECMKKKNSPETIVEGYL